MGDERTGDPRASEPRCHACGEPNPRLNLLCRSCGARLDLGSGPRPGEAGQLVQIRRRGDLPPGGARSPGPAASPGIRPIAWPWLGLSVLTSFLTTVALVLLLGRSRLGANLGAVAGILAGSTLVTLVRGQASSLVEPVLGNLTVYLLAVVLTHGRYGPAVPLPVYLAGGALVGLLAYGGAWLGRRLRRRWQA